MSDFSSERPNTRGQLTGGFMEFPLAFVLFQEDLPHSLQAPVGFGRFPAYVRGVDPLSQFCPGNTLDQLPKIFLYASCSSSPTTSASTHLKALAHHPGTSQPSTSTPLHHHLLLIPGSKGVDILSAKGRIRPSYPSQILEKDGVGTMDDKDEYMYAWRTANCLLKTIKTFTPPYTPTYAVLDLGGPSTLNRVRACVHVLGYAARGGRAQLRSADQWPQLCVVSVLVFWGSASFMHGHASGLDVNVSGYEAEGGRGEPVSCEGDTENKDEALDVKRKATMDGWTLGLSMHVIRSCSLCRRKTCLILKLDHHHGLVLDQHIQHVAQSTGPPAIALNGFPPSRPHSNTELQSPGLGYSSSAAVVGRYLTSSQLLFALDAVSLPRCWIIAQRKPWRFGSDDMPQIRQPTILVHCPCCARRGPTTVLCQTLITTIRHPSPPSTCEAMVVNHPAATDQSALQPPEFTDLLSAPIITTSHHLPQGASLTEPQTTHMFLDQATHPPSTRPMTF
ncbi:uncharacterized protein LACBIDRAFT_334341 [Laccaria bicolor S238N-H82]|nr:uncharacterized protein LACBIDRAFT_334341 [Laccaria bicolor S238N-H82]EDR00217.1 predicted protein [Laccaria bicolor S238N-H82]|eukprot:XP_001889126.1 predicted protein [Laccaria bicolor S238N-H82]